MSDDPTKIFRRWARRAYLHRHQRQRRADAKAEGSRRIDVTLRGEMLDDYVTVRRYIEGLNRFIAERSPWADPFRLSDTEIIRMALRRAASAIHEDDEQSRKAGLVRMLD